MVDFNRRQIVAGVATAAVSLGTAVVPGSARGEACSATPGQAEGPFYPSSYPERDWDLTRVGGRLAEGDIVELEGRLLDRSCRPVAGARVEIWQCNRFGRYHHPRDPGSEDRPLDPGFQGFGEVVTAADGAYRFRTIKPVPYPAGRNVWRTAHIHYKVRVGGAVRLITQLYLDGHPFNESDWLFMAVDPDKRALLTTGFGGRRADGTPVGRFDLGLG